MAGDRIPIGDSKGIWNPLLLRPNWPRLELRTIGIRMQILSAKDAKYGFGRLIDLARVESITLAMHWTASRCVLGRGMRLA